MRRGWGEGRSSRIMERKDDDKERGKERRAREREEREERKKGRNDTRQDDSETGAQRPMMPKECGQCRGETPLRARQKQ